MDENCVFCKIVTGKLPADKKYEDEEMLVFPDVHPSAPVHLLIVSKVHGEEFHTVDASKLSRMLSKVREMIGELNFPYRVAMNGGSDRSARSLTYSFVGTGQTRPSCVGRGSKYVMPTVVRKKPGQSDDRLIADFRKKVLNEELILEMKKREYYRKPSVIRQEKIKERRGRPRRRSY